MLALRSADQHPPLIAWLGQSSEGGRRLIWDAEQRSRRIRRPRAVRWLGFPPSFFLPFFAGKNKRRRATHTIRRDTSDAAAAGLALTAAAVP